MLHLLPAEVFMPKPSLSVKYSNLVVKFSNKALLLRLKFTVVRAHVAHSVYPVLRWHPFFVHG